MADPTAAEIEAAAEALSVQARPTRRDRQRAEMVLRAVLPDHDARVRADERARVAEEIARDIADNPGPNPSPSIPAWWAGWVEGRDESAGIARAYATPPTTEEDRRNA